MRVCYTLGPWEGGGIDRQTDDGERKGKRRRVICFVIDLRIEKVGIVEQVEEEEEEEVASFFLSLIG